MTLLLEKMTTVILIEIKMKQKRKQIYNDPNRRLYVRFSPFRSIQ